MSTMNISLPESLKDFVDKQVGEHGYSTSSEYVRELLRREQDRQKLRAMILEGARSPLTGPADEAYFERMRERVRQMAKSRTDG